MAVVMMFLHQVHSGKERWQVENSLGKIVACSFSLASYLNALNQAIIGSEIQGCVPPQKPLLHLFVTRRSKRTIYSGAKMCFRYRYNTF